MKTKTEPWPKRTILQSMQTESQTRNDPYYFSPHSNEELYSIALCTIHGAWFLQLVFAAFCQALFLTNIAASASYSSCSSHSSWPTANILARSRSYNVDNVNPCPWCPRLRRLRVSMSPMFVHNSKSFKRVFCSC